MKIITVNEFQKRIDRNKDSIVRSLIRAINKGLRKQQTDFFLWNHAMWSFSPLKRLHLLSREEQDQIFMRIWKEELEPGGWKDISWHVDEYCIQIKITKP